MCTKMWICTKIRVYIRIIILKGRGILCAMRSLKVKWVRIHHLDENTVKDKVAKNPGVYRLSFYEEKGKAPTIFYVGKAYESLQRRLLEHLSNEEKNDCVKSKIAKHVCAFKLAYVDKEEDRSDIEHTMYEKFGNLCNVQEPEGNLVEVNFNNE